MSDSEKPQPGMISWIDLTVPDAEKVKEFYGRVVGWKHAPVEMDGYNDFCMMPSEGDHPVAGICHARGTNADIPAQWLLYITVENLDESMQHCAALGGETVIAPKKMGSFGRYSVIRDPSGAVAALFEPA